MLGKSVVVFILEGEEGEVGEFRAMSWEGANGILPGMVLSIMKYLESSLTSPSTAEEDSEKSGDR